MPKIYSLMSLPAASSEGRFFWGQALNVVNELWIMDFVWPLVGNLAVNATPETKQSQLSTIHLLHFRLDLKKISLLRMQQVRTWGCSTHFAIIVTINLTSLFTFWADPPLPLGTYIPYGWPLKYFTRYSYCKLNLISIWNNIDMESW